MPEESFLFKLAFLPKSSSIYSESPWGDTDKWRHIMSRNNRPVAYSMDQEQLNELLLARVCSYYESDGATEIWLLGAVILDSEGGSQQSRMVAAQLAAFCRQCDEVNSRGHIIPDMDFKTRAYIAIHVCLRSLSGDEASLFLGAMNRCVVLYQPQLALAHLPEKAGRYLKSLT